VLYIGGMDEIDEPALVRNLVWRKAEPGWRLYAKGRRFGDVVPDTKYPGMWRVKLSGGRLSDMANLSWARNAVLEAAVREIEYEARAATTPPKPQQIAPVFQPTSPPMSQTDVTATPLAPESENALSESVSLTVPSSMAA
jgi:hypothetical protein